MHKGIIWLEKPEIIAAQKLLIAVHGGSSGIRDEGLLESALARPQNLRAYSEDASIEQLAAAYGFGLAKNHPFVDGNKRIAYVAIELFLDLNGVAIRATESEKYEIMITVAAGEIDEAGFAKWLDVHCATR